jgi:hypothetical protein
MPNTSDNPEFADVAARALARRSVLKATGVGAGALVLHAGLNGTLAAAAVQQRPYLARLNDAAFSPVKPNVRDSVTVPKGFGHHVVIGWGDKVVPGAPEFDVAAQTAEKQRKQFGYNCDYVGVLPVNDLRALLVVNHEYTDPELMFDDSYDAESKLAVEMAAHGMSIVEIKRSSKTSGTWVQVPVSNTKRNRRIHTSSTMKLVGPAAGDPRLMTSADPSGKVVLGTLNNCAGGMTPWGTVLSGEENFNQYFDKSGALDPAYSASYARYGITGSGSRGWSSVDPRFDLTNEPHEPFRFGWIVEVDPYNPTSTPRKHTMLGRFKHEGANVVVAKNGKVVVYMGDDERGDYIYKFVTRDAYDASGTASARRHNLGLLLHGTLFVARFTDEVEDDAPEYDGVGRWIPLASDTTSYVPGMSVAEVLIDTRLAADKLAPTRMDRPEDVEVNPINGKVYAALTNNSQRGTTWAADEANPITSSQTRSALGATLSTKSGNRNGYILEMTATNGDHTKNTFTWDLMLVCGDPAAPETYFAGFPKDQVSPISCPDNVAFDPAGNLWISTDGNVLGSNDGIFKVPVTGPQRGHVQQFLTVPFGAEACGPLITGDGRSLWVAVQHPGETSGSTFASPSSTWPHSHDFPRPAVVVVYEP